MRASLVRVKADGTTQPVPVRTSPTVVGRNEDCEFRIPLPDVSRRHCEIRLDDGRLVITDLKSSNGTYVNRERLTEPTPLEPGDLVSLGGLVFVVKIDGQPEQIDAPLCYEDGLPLPEEAAGGTKGAASGGGGGARKEPPTRPTGPMEAVTEPPSGSGAPGKGSVLDDELDAFSGDLDESSMMGFDFDLDEDDALGKQPDL